MLKKRTQTLQNIISFVIRVQLLYTYQNMYKESESLKSITCNVQDTYKLHDLNAFVYNTIYIYIIYISDYMYYDCGGVCMCLDIYTVSQISVQLSMMLRVKVSMYRIYIVYAQQNLKWLVFYSFINYTNVSIDTLFSITNYTNYEEPSSASFFSFFICLYYLHLLRSERSLYRLKLHCV